MNLFYVSQLGIYEMFHNLNRLSIEKGWKSQVFQKERKIEKGEEFQVIS
jgi:hypothetical protein